MYEVINKYFMILIRDMAKLFPLGDLEPMAYYCPSTMSQEYGKPWGEDHLWRIVSPYPS